MAGALSALGLGREKFCRGRWLAILAFAEDPETLSHPAGEDQALVGARRVVQARTAAPSKMTVSRSLTSSIASSLWPKSVAPRFSLTRPLSKTRSRTSSGLPRSF